MHEAAIAQSLIELVRQEMKSRGVQKVSRIGIRLGELSDVVPEALAFAYSSIIKDTEFSGATLSIEQMSLHALCKKCNVKFSIKDEHFVCPECGSVRVVLQKGDEIELAFIET